MSEPDGIDGLEITIEGESVPYDPERVERVLQYEARAEEESLDAPEDTSTTLVEALLSEITLSQSKSLNENTGTILPIDISDGEKNVVYNSTVIEIPFLYNGETHSVEYTDGSKELQYLLDYCGVKRKNILDLEECTVPVFEEHGLTPYLCPPQNSSLVSSLVYETVRKLHTVHLADVAAVARNGPVDPEISVQHNLNYYSLMAILGLFAVTSSILWNAFSPTPFVTNTFLKAVVDMGVAVWGGLSLGYFLQKIPIDVTGTVERIKSQLNPFKQN
jgi:hypothetical protein